jgi:hypothetical protein
MVGGLVLHYSSAYHALKALTNQDPRTLLRALGHPSPPTGVPNVVFNMYNSCCGVKSLPPGGYCDFAAITLAISNLPQQIKNNALFMLTRSPLTHVGPEFQISQILLFLRILLLLPKA